MKRLLMALVFFTIAVYLLRRLTGLFARGGPRAEGGAGADPRGRATELVRDRICNTFLPRDRALSLDRAGQTHYFCSEACRSRHLAGLGALEDGHGATGKAS